MRLRISLILGIAVCCFSQLNAQIEENPQKLFKEFYPLEGAWFYATDRGDRLEEWVIDNDSTISGRRFRIRENTTDTIVLETMRLELQDDKILYSSIARNQNNNEPVVYQLVKADYDGYQFETDMIENPSKINYQIFGKREIQINTEGTKNGRKVTEEFVYEREFSKSEMGFFLRAGVNSFNLAKTGTFQKIDEDPEFGWRPGWELGSGVTFKGQGGYFALNIEVAFLNKNSDVTSAFVAIEDTTFTEYRRDGYYRSNWLHAAFLPEFYPVREGRFSIIAGPYIAQLISLRAKGTIVPAEDGDLFDSSEDLGKTDFGIIGGIQYKLNFTKKDIGGTIGLRANIGLKNLDNLYDRGCDNSAFCNGQLFFRGVSLYYAVDLLKL